MNQLAEVKEKPISYNMMDLGLSTLHARINMMECLLHISHRLDFKKWAARDADRVTIKLRQQVIRDRFQKELSLFIDMIKQGHGTTNDGNTARRFFENPKKTADITGLNEDLICRFAVILQAITSGEHINVEKFKKYSLETAEKFVELYGMVSFVINFFCPTFN